jgi:hypothetical protein
MTSYTFEANIHSEESIFVTPEEQEEVFKLMAEEAAAEGYAEWSAEVSGEEEPVKDWLKGYTNRQSGPTHEGWAI